MLKIEFENDFIMDSESGEIICHIEDLGGKLLKMVITSLIAERDKYEDEILELNMDIEVLEGKIEYLEEEL